MDQLSFLAVGFFSCEGSRARCRNGVEHYDGRDARAARSLHHIGHFDVSCHRRNAGGEVNLVLLFVVIGSVDLNIMCFFLMESIMYRAFLKPDTHCSLYVLLK